MRASVYAFSLYSCIVCLTQTAAAWSLTKVRARTSSLSPSSTARLANASGSSTVAARAMTTGLHLRTSARRSAVKGVVGPGAS